MERNYFRRRLTQLVLLTGLLMYVAFILHQAQQLQLDYPHVHIEFKSPRTRDGKSRSTYNVSIFCLVLTTHNSIRSKAKAVNNTWGRRCNKTIFFTNRKVEMSNVVHLDNTQDGRQHLTEKIVKSFQYVKKYYGGYDWYLKADDDTYVIVENLRDLLSYFQSSEPIYLGQNFKYFTKQGYHSGGAGYVLSKSALGSLLKGVEYNKCSKDGHNEDVDIGRCLDRQGVKAYDTTDKFKRETFHGGSIEEHIVGPFSDLLKNYPSTEAKRGIDCCSSLTISFHYVPPKWMYVMDTLLYHLTVFGRDYKESLDVFDPD